MRSSLSKSSGSLPIILIVVAAILILVVVAFLVLVVLPQNKTTFAPQKPSTQTQTAPDNSQTHQNTVTLLESELNTLEESSVAEDFTTTDTTGL